jgi:membrane-associated phospholipid phosphatase
MERAAPKSGVFQFWRRSNVRAIAPRPLFEPQTWGVLALTLAALVLAFIYVDPIAIAWQRRLPEWFKLPFEYLDYFGWSGTILWPVGIAILLLFALMRLDLPRRSQATVKVLQLRLVLVFLAIGAPGLAASILKRVIGRLRPWAFDSQGHLAFNPAAWTPDAASFPSGHATTAFAAAVVFAALWPRARVLVLVLATLAALARIVLDAHYTSDAIGGAVFGSLGAALVVRAFARRRLTLKITADGIVRPMPGPSMRRIIALATSIGDAIARTRASKSAADGHI